MRITRDLLLSTASDKVKRDTFGNHDIVCAYLTGSLTRENPLIGGTTDIDLVYIHSLDVPAERELIPIAEDFHFDIAHYHQSLFNKPKTLRSNAWIGSFLCDYPILLYDTNHWFDYVRSGVFAHFHQPVNVIQRVKPFADAARQKWIELQNLHASGNEISVLSFLKTISDAANAISCITSVPLTDRRFLIDFPKAARAINMPGLVGGLVDLIVPADPIEPDWGMWMEGWKNAFSALQHTNSPPLPYSVFRQPYYEKAITGMKDDQTHAALWLMLWTWSLMDSYLQSETSGQDQFTDILNQLMLRTEHFADRLNGLDQFLDTVEETIDNWQASTGI